MSSVPPFREREMCAWYLPTGKLVGNEILSQRLHEPLAIPFALNCPNRSLGRNTGTKVSETT